MFRVVLSQNKVLVRFAVFSAIIIVPWCAYFSLRFVGPIKFFPLSEELLTYVLLVIVCSYLSFSLGFLKTQSIGEARRLSVSRFYRARYLVCSLAIVFPLAAAIDFFVFKGAAITEIVAQREAEHLTGPRNSLIGAVVAISSGSPPLAYIMLKERAIENRYLHYTVLTIIALGFASMFLSGGRNSFFISVLLLLSYSYFFSKAEIHDRKSRAIPVSLFTFFFIFSMKMFVDRFEEQGFHVSFMLDYLSVEYDVEIERIESQSSFISAAYSVYVYLVFYITHSLTYLNDYFTVNYSPLLSGSYNFPVIARFFDIIVGGSTFEVGRDKLLVEGVYLSWPGSIYLDFGYVFSILLLSLICFFYGYLSRNIANLSLYQKLIVSYLTVCFIFSPIYSVFGMANGFSLICLLCVVVFCYVRIDLNGHVNGKNNL